MAHLGLNWHHQVKLALELRKPLFLHCRDAADSLARILAQHSLTAPAVVHCFTGSEAELRRFLGMGLHVGITGWVRCAPGMGPSAAGMGTQKQHAG
jgi:TatD DNase family protein